MDIKSITMKGCSKVAKRVLEKLTQRLDEINKEEGLGAIRLKGEGWTVVCWTGKCPTCSLKSVCSKVAVRPIPTEPVGCTVINLQFVFEEDNPELIE